MEISVTSAIRRDFIELAIRCDVLKFGEFELKSGRISPYFFNAGGFSDGGALATLGRCYAAALNASALPFETLFGPAYKGIPLVAATAIALSEQHGRDVPYTFNRKEAKAHGEGGTLVGAPLTGRVVIVDDVITAGTAIRESVALIRSHGAEAAAVIIGLDRCERGTGSQSAVQEAQEDLGLAVHSVITLHDIIDWLATSEQYQSYRVAMQQYRERYGV